MRTLPRRAAATALALLLLGACSDPMSQRVPVTVPLAAILDFQGDLGQDGPLRLAAMEEAIADANAEFADQNLAFELTYGDAQSDPQAALVLLNSFLLQGARIVVGPFSSAQVAGVSTRIFASNSLVLSPSSTSLELAASDDHTFRIVPTDAYLVDALVDRMWAEGRRRIAIAYRGDSWGRSVSGELEREFVARGGTVAISRPYAALRPSLVEQMLTDLHASLDGADPDETAVVLASFDEGSLVFEVASEQVPDLGDYRWYGADGFVSDQTTVNTPALAEFAIKVRYAAPIFRVPVPAAKQDVVARIEASTGRDANPYALLSYDAVRAARVIAGLPEDADYESLRDALVTTLQGMDELSGPILLDAAGDRLGGSYEFYTVQASGGSYSWVTLSP